MKSKVSRVTLDTLAAATEEMALGGVGCSVFRRERFRTVVSSTCVHPFDLLPKVSRSFGAIPGGYALAETPIRALNIFKCSFLSWRSGIYSFIVANPKLT